MAIVFVATDIKHEREVAVKMLRPELSSLLGADRFLREIHLTAQLQHPHIVPLYDSGAAGDLLYYVMPFVPGESLRERLRREHQLPVDEALSITRAVAGALDYAHRHGVLHRDIKPENILLHDGQPMLADFGIALAVSTSGGERLTHSGIFVGTPSYMSPEHATGERAIDARSDIYALACVAYEMLCGDPPFTGVTTQAVIAAMMTTEAKPLDERRRTVPPAAAAAIHRALEPIPADRFATAANFAAALTAGPSSQPRVRKGVRRHHIIPLLAACAGIVIGIAVARLMNPGAPSTVRRWNLVLPTDAPVALTGPTSALGWQTAIAIAPAGDRLVYVVPHSGTTALAMRPFDGDSAIILPGTEGAYLPFFSPNGAWIGFFSGNLLRKVAAGGGTPATLGVVDRITGAAWPTPSRILVFENEGFDLHWVTANGTAADSIVRLTTQFGTPNVLPGGRWAVGQLSSGQLALLSLSEGTELAVTRRGVLPMGDVGQSDLLFGTSPHWVEPGYLVYGAGDGVLTALPFDGSKRRVAGGPVPLTSGVRMEAGFGYGEFAIAHDGTLVYVPGTNQVYNTIAFVTPQGRIDTLPFPRDAYNQPRISPDGTTLAVQVRDAVGGWRVLLMNLANGVRQTVPVAGNYRAFPASWVPPSSREIMIGLWDPVQFKSYGARIQSLETGQGTDVRLPGASYMTVAPDGRSFVFSDWRTGDLYLRSLGADTTRTRVPARGVAASFSPNGRWLAWGGVDGSVGVSPVPPTGAVYAIAERGQMPVWTPQGDAVIYRNGSGYYRVHLSTAGGFRADRPQLLVEGSFLSSFSWNHAISPDGRLLVLLNSPERQSATLKVITGFPAMVEQLARANQSAR